MVFKPQKITKKKSKKIMENYKNLNLKNLKIKTNDNCLLDALYLHNPNTKNVILFSHGNAGNLYNNFDIFLRLGKFSSILMYDYRGYGLSKGNPEEFGIYKDILSVYKYMTHTMGIKPKYITLYGISLGCCPTLWLAKKISKYGCSNNIHSIIIESGFSSEKNLAEEIFPKYLSYLIQNNFNNMKNIKKINCNIPILIAHSPQDELININHKNKLYDKCLSIKKEYYQLKGSHNADKLDEYYIKKIKEYLYE